MERELICLIICFIVGVLLFYLLKHSCGCNVVEGNADDDNNSFGCCISYLDKCVVDMECLDYYNNNYRKFNCDQYCKFMINRNTNLSNINIPDSVTYLYVKNINLSQIVSSLQELNNLQELYIYDNDSSGTDFNFLENFKMLQKLELGHNKLSGSDVGTIPDLPMLKNLEISGNNLSGTDFIFLSKLTNLQHLDLLEVYQDQYFLLWARHLDHKKQ